MSSSFYEKKQNSFNRANPYAKLKSSKNLGVSQSSVFDKRKRHSKKVVKALESDKKSLEEVLPSPKEKSVLLNIQEKRCESKVLIIATTVQLSKGNKSLLEIMDSLDDFLHETMPYYDTIEYAKPAEYNENKLDVQSPDYKRLAFDIEENYLDYDGFVIIHQKQTLPYSASYISFMLENLAKPVVFTTAATGLDQVYSDGKMNLITAMIIAGQTSLCEVVVSLNGKIFRANRVTMRSNISFHSFLSPNLKPLGQFGTNLFLFSHANRTVPKKMLKVHKEMFPNVITVTVTPMTNAEQLRLLLCKPGRKGVILCCYGVGNAPEKKEIRDTLQDAIENFECEVVVTTQCVFGHVNMKVYGSGSFYSNIGLISSSDMTLEACVAKLSYLMGKGYSGKELKRKFEEPICGEMISSFELSQRVVDYKLTQINKAVRLQQH